MSAQSTNRIGFNKGTKNQGIMQENNVNKTDDAPCADDAFVKEKVNEFAKDMASFFDSSDKAKREMVDRIGDISNCMEHMDKSLNGMRYDIDHLDTRLRRIECLLKDQKRLTEKRNNSLNAIELLLAFISIALFVIVSMIFFR